VTRSIDDPERYAAPIVAAVPPVGDREYWGQLAICPRCHARTLHRTTGPDPAGAVRVGACNHKYILGRPVAVPTQSAAGAA
jgi:hypothetical protein